MPQDSLSFMQRLQEYGVLGYAWILVLSAWAGTAKYLGSLDGRKPTFLGWLTDTCVSGFVGVIAAMTCQYYQLDFLITSAITGICAHNGTRSLYFISEIVKKNTSVSTGYECQAPKRTRLAKRSDQDNDSKE